MKYTVIGKSLYDYLGIVPDEELEARNEEITDLLLGLMKDRKTAVLVDAWGIKWTWIDDGRYAWATLGDAIDALPIKDGVNLVRFENGNLGPTTTGGSRTLRSERMRRKSRGLRKPAERMMKMTTDIREVLEGIAKDMGASRPQEMSDTELVDYITGE